ncbi:hypothetical protein [Halorubellus salinus]|uniref:hypothetical protein n=1 Tax=Halorubellus salinus TaxID=755309 RepID=UPI001D07AFCF|nr:hypothetical protein [Halorubellus salinus]
MNRRTLLLGTLAVVSSTAGCLESAKDSGTTEMGTTDDSGTTEMGTTDDSTTEMGTTDDSTTVHAMDAPDPDHAIWVENEAATTHQIAVTVTQHVDDGPDEVVHESTHELQPKGSEYVYNLNEANPDGVERFKITGETGEQTASRFMATSKCYTDCGIVLRERGELVVERPIC